MDSNHRRYNQQIYSLPHLATLVLALVVPDACSGHGSEPMGGFEPSTPRLQITCSGQLSYIGSISSLFIKKDCKDTYYLRFSKNF